MIYLRIENQSSQAIALVELLKTMPFVEILEEHQPNYITREAMRQAEEGKVEYYDSARNLLKELKK